MINAEKAPCLLPAHSTSTLEKQLSDVLGEFFTLPVRIPLYWRIKDTPSNDLLYSAENLNIRFLSELADDEQDKRIIIQHSAAIFKKIGTPWAIKYLCRLLGFGNVQVNEAGRPNQHRWDKIQNNDLRWNGAIQWGSSFTGEWYEYEIIVKQAVPPQKVAALHRLLPYVQPARCRLKGIVVNPTFSY